MPLLRLIASGAVVFLFASTSIVYGQSLHGGSSPGLTVRGAYVFCNTHMNATREVAVHGYFFATYSALGAQPNPAGWSHVRGGLFSTAHVPHAANGSISRWKFYSGWEKYGALFLVFRNVIPPKVGILDQGWITAHGRLVCRSRIIYVDADPFPLDLPLPSGPPLEIPTKVKSDQTESAPPKLRLRLLPMRLGVPLTAQATIIGPSLCTLTVTATRSNGARKVIFTGADNDGPRRGEYVGNYMVVAKVPPATKLIMASATCRYSARGRSRRVKLSASIFVK
jgi:hypothetical protein